MRAARLIVLMILLLTGAPSLGRMVGRRLLTRRGGLELQIGST
jgi:hypothetical protein